MILYIYDRAGIINLTSYDFGYDNAYVLDYNFDSYGGGVNSIVVDYIADGLRKQAGVIYEIQYSGTYQPLYYRELEYNFSTGRFEILYEITDLGVAGYSLESMVDDIIFAKANHWYLISGNDTIYGNSYGGFFDTGIGDDIVYGFGGSDHIWIGAGNDTAYGGTGNDYFYTTPASSNFGGINYVYGESGTDTLIISSSQIVARLVDVWGAVYPKGSDLILVVGNASSQLYATGIELIKYSNGNTSALDDWGFYLVDVSFRPGYELTDKNYTSNDTKYTIDLGEYIATTNYGETTKYEIKLSNSSYNDQFSLSGDILTINNGSGSTDIVDVTITASAVSSNGKVRTGQTPATKTFSVTFKDNNNSSSVSSETSENDSKTLTSENDSSQAGADINKIGGEESTDTSSGTRIDIDSASITATDDAETFVYDASWDGDEVVGSDGNVSISGFNLSSDKLVILTGDDIPSDYDRSQFENNSKGTQQIVVDAINNKTVIYFAPDSDGVSSTLTLEGVVDEKSLLNIVFGASIGDDVAAEAPASTDQSYKLSISKNEYGPTLNEYSSLFNNSGTLNLKSSDEIIVLTGQAGNIRGLGGSDTYIISDLITSNAKIKITDTDGQNIIQIPDNTKITKVLFVSNAARLWLSNDQEITINSADKHTYNVSGNSAGGDLGNSYTYEEFVNLFGVDIGSGEQTVNLYTKSDEKSSSNYKIIDLSATADKTVTATSDAEDFRYEVNSSGNSIEGPYTITINNFDKENDKLTLVNTDGSSSLTTQEFDELSGVDITSDELSGTQIFFAPDSSGQSGSLTISDLVETFSTAWEATTYTVEITPKANLASATSSGDLTYSFADNLDTNKVVLTAFNTSTDSGSANYTAMSEILVLTGQGASIRGLAGDDTYILSNLIPENSKISIVDTDGDNVIQIPDNTYIDATLFTKNASRVTLSDGREITINSADKFTYNIGANVTTGDSSENLTFTEFASAFGIDDVLNLSGSSTGTISDQYII